MSDQEQDKKTPPVQYESGVPILRRIDEMEQKRADDERRDQRYKDEQITITHRLATATEALVVATIVMGLIGCIQIWYTHRQWKLTSSGLSKMGDQIWAARDAAVAARQSADIARDALVQVQRAFVFPNPTPKVEEVVGSTPETGEVRVTIPWENSGTTPTEWMRFNIISVFLDREMPGDFTFPERVQAGKPKLHPYTVIPPKGSIEATASIPVGIINQWWAGKKHIYLYGWARYRDVFPNTPEHLTRFCYEMVKVNIPPALAPPLRPGLVNYAFNLNQCRRNNCYDEQCQQK